MTRCSLARRASGRLWIQVSFGMPRFWVEPFGLHEISDLAVAMGWRRAPCAGAAWLAEINRGGAELIARLVLPDAGVANRIRRCTQTERAVTVKNVPLSSRHRRKVTALATMLAPERGPEHYIGFLAHANESPPVNVEQIGSIPPQAGVRTEIAGMIFEQRGRARMEVVEHIEELARRNRRPPLLARPYLARANRRSILNRPSTEGLKLRLAARAEPQSAQKSRDSACGWCLQAE